MRGLLILVALAGCSTKTAMTPAPDLAMSPDLGPPPCTLSYSGDVTETVMCRIFLCHPTGGDYESLDLAGPIDNPLQAHAIFEVAGTLAVRSYTGAELRGFDAGIFVNNTRYTSNSSLPATTAALTVTDIQAPSGEPCNGLAHGTATATLVEVDAMGMPQTGRVTVAATF